MNNLNDKENINIHGINFDWDLQSGSLKFFDIPSTLFWNDPSLLNMFKPLVHELGKEMFCLQVAYSSSLGTDEDYNSMVTKFAKTFDEGFLSWGKAVSGAGWGIFELPYFDPKNIKAKVIIHNPWELSMQKNLKENEQWGCPFLQGKIIGIFNHALKHTCWADEIYFIDGDQSRVEFDIYSYSYTIQDKIESLRQLKERKKVQKLKKHIEDAIKEKDELLEKEKKLKNDLEESELLKRNILSTLPDMIWLKDIKGVYQSCNPEFELFFGAKEIDIIGKTDYDFVNKELADSFRENDMKAMYADKPSINEEWITNATDGRKVLFETTKTPLKNKHNETIGVLGIGHDITQHHKEKVFMEKNSKILKMIATGVLASKVYDEIALMYEARHPGMRCSLLELENGVLLHGGAPSMPKEYCDAVHGLRNGPTVGSCGASTYTGKRMIVENIDTHPNWAEIKQFALPHGMRSCWSEPIIGSQGKVLGAFGMYYDYPALPNEEEAKDLLSAARLASIIMERDQSQRRMNKDQKIISEQNKLVSMGEMIGNIAHQWRQPLSVISTTVTGLKLQKEMNALDDNDFYHYMDVVNDSTQYLSQTIEDFRNFLNPKNSKSKEFLISEAINKTLKIISSQFVAKDIKIIKNIEDKSIFCFENELIQVLINLLNNSRDALVNSKNETKLIFINTYIEKKILYIEIKDNGGGIKKDIISRVFEPYFTTKHQSKGTGIGLYMSQDILKTLLNGDISVENDIYNYNGIEYKGAKFTISLRL
jgi:PAS domain S-box-containing protein